MLVTKTSYQLRYGAGPSQAQGQRQNWAPPRGGRGTVRAN